MSASEPTRVHVRVTAPKREAEGYGRTLQLARSLPRTGRLLKHSDFQRVYQQGRRHFSANMTVFYLRREQGAEVRVGLTVSKVLGGAVDRNRIKRRMRAAVRQCPPPRLAAADVVINPKKSLLKVDFVTLVAEVGRAFLLIEQKLNQPPRAT